MEASTTPKPLPNRPEQKMAPIPKGSRIQKRPLPAPLSHRLSSSSSNKPSPSLSTISDPDGYHPPPRAPHTLLIKVSSSAPFMSLVKRVRKGLESRSSLSRQQTTKGLPLTARIAALDTNTTAGGSSTTGEGGPTEDALDDVVLVATGRAIQKAVEVGCFFTRERDLRVLLRTRTVRGVDDVVREEGGGDEGEGSGGEEEEAGMGARVRAVSCVEVGVRWRAT